MKAVVDPWGGGGGEVLEVLEVLEAQALSLFLSQTEAHRGKKNYF